MSIVINIVLIVIGVLLFGFVIFFHEFGHFSTAKLCGIKVNEFAVGMGPKIFSKVKGETRYSLRLLPIGGYCAMEGEDEASDDPGAFGNKPVWQRALVIVAGGLFNIVLGIILMAIMLSTSKLYATTTLSRFEDTSPMAAAGMQIDDRVTDIDGYKVHTSRDLFFALGMSDPNDVDFEVVRDGKTLKFDNIKMNADVDEDGKATIKTDFRVFGIKPTFGVVLKGAFTETYSFVRMVFASLKGIITRQFGLNDMAGPVGTAQVISQAASAGLQEGKSLMEGFTLAVGNIMMMIILVTVNLGIMNLLPIPALDGGRLLFLGYEMIFRKPVPTKYEGVVHAVGFVLLMALMVVLTFNDIVRIVTGG